jgi:N-acetylglucosamine kinase-like BadF-type ATPase
MLLAKMLGFEEQVVVETDLLGGAYACLGSENGAVGNMGTGSVAFRYEDQNVIERRGGWGYLLGDEGGGSSLGRRLLRRLSEGRLPAHLQEAYRQWSGLCTDEMIRAIYSDPVPGLYLARQVPFIAEYIKDPAMQDLVRAEIGLFLDTYLLPLVENETRVMLMGGIARIFQDVAIGECRTRGLDRVEILTESPIIAIARHIQNT